ncbi:hypothetical protein AD45P2_00420 [Alteromonas phage vB_AmaP_AD45-P2]|uniref:Uncharacterized protein n=1 Tax=Pseudorhizobium pelagicum TaxID=1509405 RepID=A0A922NYA0_9HYPH|nr:hypothetical protein M610_gp098 [Alteromonas phage vB_AmaP_AD45-P1]AGM47017.1 hypothetical protein AD45P3_00395 [Alteromonas phage vB_AmaP_AD45-P3]AGM47133.1 hypothetical protein AD45P4_00390 [Alteromonas phage vB_AmaP_AD45-P4]AGM47255.1 hypothetical protein AD45P2_00420 [Alteromonas phage vB_AmaP_AD45-P2]KEQ05625.1 hypothetical protein GV68_08840 [Pseudorhizobium pelagicum]AGM46901.1 hypothetical protein AD45P1_00415 [Alteromonas phage vB_AmaP_AD45-P1]
MDIYRVNDNYVLFAEEVHITVPFTHYVLHKGQGKYEYAMLYFNNHYTGVIIHQLGLPNFLHCFAYAQPKDEHEPAVLPSSH